jgi:hypothetical protein
MRLWWCMECQATVGLSKHGTCEVCGSEAVDLLSTDGELSGSVSAVQTESDAAPSCS